MLNCDTRAFARCPYKQSCGSMEHAQFEQGSDCDLFNKKILNTQITVADRIRGMEDRELAMFLHTITRACADKNCSACPIGENNCTVMLHWIRQPELEWRI